MARPSAVLLLIAALMAQPTSSRAAGIGVTVARAGDKEFTFTYSDNRRTVPVVVLPIPFLEPVVGWTSAGDVVLAARRDESSEVPTPFRVWSAADSGGGRFLELAGQLPAELPDPATIALRAACNRLGAVTLAVDGGPTNTRSYFWAPGSVEARLVRSTVFDGFQHLSGQRMEYAKVTGIDGGGRLYGDFLESAVESFNEIDSFYSLEADFRGGSWSQAEDPPVAFDASIASVTGANDSGILIATRRDGGGLVGGTRVEFSPLSINSGGIVLGWDGSEYIIWHDGRYVPVRIGGGAASAANHEVVLPDSVQWLGRIDDAGNLVGAGIDGGQIMAPLGADVLEYLMPGSHFTPARFPAGWAAELAIDAEWPGAYLGMGVQQVEEGGITRPERALFLAVPASMRADANGDGQIGDDYADDTTPDAPFRYWVNDDDDKAADDGEDCPLGVEDRNADCRNGIVDSERDLVDFFPVAFELSGLRGLFPASSGARYVLRQDDEAVKIVYSNLVRSDACSFQTRRYEAGFGDGFDRPPGAAQAHAVTHGGLVLQEGFLELAARRGGAVLLVEGCAISRRPLVLAVEREGKTLASMKLDLCLSPVESMFRHVDLTGAAREYDGTAITPPVAVLPQRVGDPGDALPDTASNEVFFLFVHGFNVDGRAARGWNAEVFKRLRVRGSHARFVGVTWNGSPPSALPGRYLDYHKAVFQAFQAGDALQSELASFIGDAPLAIAAHSLGNVVAGRAIQEHHLKAFRYFMINAAVPIESYVPDEVSDEQRSDMVETTWRGYESRLRASEWYRLFENDADDARNRLTWRGIFTSVAESGVACNFHSPGEDVVANMEGVHSGSVVLQILRQGLDLATGAWKTQEMLKGLGLTSSLGTLFLDRQQGGWGFNKQWYVTERAAGPPGKSTPTIIRHRRPGEAQMIGSFELKTKPLFAPFSEDRLRSLDASVASGAAAVTGVHDDVLARGVPATSYAMAANPVHSFGNRDFDMEASARANVPWPQSSGGGRWRHSDFKKMALLYVYPMYDEMIRRGGLK